MPQHRRIVLLILHCPSIWHKYTKSVARMFYFNIYICQVVSLHQSHKQFLEKASNSFVFLFPSVKSMRCALPSFMALTIVNRCQDPRDSAASRWCAASSSPPRHISLCKYITSTSTSSEVWTYTECLVWFGLAIDQWELRWLSIIFRPMRRELTKLNKSKLSAVQDPEPLYK